MVENPSLYIYKSDCFLYFFFRFFRYTIEMKPLGVDVRTPKKVSEKIDLFLFLDENIRCHIYSPYSHIYTYIRYYIALFHN